MSNLKGGGEVKTTYNDMGKQVRNPELKICEAKPYEVYDGLHTHGRNYISMVCPFCEHKSHTTAWSFAGSGKRCENKACGAVFGFGNIAYRKITPQRQGGVDDRHRI